MEISMNVRRTNLIAALTAKRDEIAEDLYPDIEVIEEDQTIINEYAKAAIAQRKETIRMLEAGELTYGLSDRRGDYINVVPVGKNKISKPPEQSERVFSAFRRQEDNRCQRERIARRTAPYDAALQLLDMSEDDHVGVPATEYQRLLEGRPISDDDDRPKMMKMTR